jgi:hypothetical protein
VNNYHRRIWTLDFIDPEDPLSELYGTSGTREFWFEPFVAADANALRFRVEFEEGDMSAIWQGFTLEPNGGTEPYDPDETPTEQTEGLKGQISLGGSIQDLHVFLDKTGIGTKQILTLVIGRLDTQPAGTGIATAQD